MRVRFRTFLSKLFPLKLKVKHTTQSLKPFKKYETDAGYDLYLYEDCVLRPGETALLPIDTIVHIPEGYVGIIFPRSSYRLKGLICQAVIDSNYTGPLRPIVTYVSPSGTELRLRAGERPVQLLVLPIEYPILHHVDDVSVGDTCRGYRGIGSTGNV